jgi:ubiquinone/menaquinone biosynthesis C-methylase UbiE
MGWRLDEVAGAGRENLDAAHVARYDGKEDANAEREVERCLALGLDADSVVVELGPGTGQFTLAVAPHCGRVVAVDVSPVMLARLRTKLDDAGVTNVEIVEAGFVSYEHHGPPAELVYSRFAMHHLPDFWKGVALSRIHGMLRPGGVFRLWDVVYAMEPGEAEDRIEAWCATGGDSVDGEWSRAELEEHVRDEHSTFTWVLEPMFERAGFTIEDAVHSGDGILAAYVLRRGGTPGA